MQLSGVLPDSSPEFAGFSTQIHKEFGIDVTKWKDPMYTKRWLDIQTGILAKHNKEAERRIAEIRAY
jgi:beta-phosphoglucomutase-like phosphatase (HAD superfamily)